MALKVLTALDHAKTQYYHFKAIIIAGMGLFTDSYDLFCITPVMKLIGRVYFDSDHEKPASTPPAIVSATVGITLVGTVVGNLVFGALGDRIGRRRVYGLCLAIMVSSSFASGFSICRTRNCVLGSLWLFRFMLGIGIGGDYPLSATIMSEFSNTRTRGSFIAAVFSMQGFGILAGSAVTMVMTKVFERWLMETVWEDLLWRIILMIGAIPAGLTFYWRINMPETARYTALVEHDVIKATNDMGKVLSEFNLQNVAQESKAFHTPPPRHTPSQPSFGLFSKQFMRLHGRNLFACAMAWFIVDIPYYSSTLFQSQIYKPWFPHTDHPLNAYQEAYNVAKFQAIIAVVSTIPGYFATVFFIERIGRRRIQMLGFFFMSIFMFSLAGPYNTYRNKHTSQVWFIILYSLTFFFSNFGPNTTTFIVPAELFPARLRTTCYGISGAAGKVGAIIGTIGFLWASQDRDKKLVEKGWAPGIGMMFALIMLGGVCMIGFIHTYIFTPETKMRSLEDNEGGMQHGELQEIRNTSSPLSAQPLRG